jgi:hypothetical protein
MSIHCAAILIGCKTTENLRTMRDIYNSFGSAVEKTATAEQLNEVSAFNFSNIISTLTRNHDR